MNTYNRRLPIYLLLDCSESMVGDALTAVHEGLNKMLFELKQNPMALETVAISIIAFSTNARQVAPLTEVLLFQMPKLSLGSGTSLGSALNLLEQCMEREIVKTSAEQKGDYKPLCFILTDGDPTDKWEEIADKFKVNISKKKANVIAVACGPDADTNKLHRITDTVIIMKNASATTFSEFFKWVSASISTTSQKIETSGEKAIDLPSLGSKELEIANPSEKPITSVPDRFIYLHSRCIKEKKFYIMKFEKKHIERGMHAFKGMGSYALETFDFGADYVTSPLKVTADLLFDAKPCPYCGNKIWGKCHCGGIHCCPESEGDITLICPWCNQTGIYSFGGGSFDVNRGAG